MPSYVVRWLIDIEADTPREAAEEAKRIMKNSDPDCIAHVFSVEPHDRPDEMVVVDLDELEGKV